MANKMLIDASHPEETRVVVLRGNRVEEFDFESANKKPLRGNIYLAKVTRVEPSLQAAFIDYGGNRHGFLAFSEIHPDYYQIPVADRQALLEEEARSLLDHGLGFIDGIGYRGWVGCEYRPRAGTEAGLAWLARHKVLTPRTPHRWGIPLHALRQSEAAPGATGERTITSKAL